MDKDELILELGIATGWDEEKIRIILDAISEIGMNIVEQKQHMVMVQTRDQRQMHWIHDSHKWVGRENDARVCVWCEAVERNVISDEMPLCPGNPAVKKLKEVVV